MPPCGTFHYFTVVPEGGAQTGPWQMQSSEAFAPAGSSLQDNRLVGWNPLLHITDAGSTPNPGPTRPAVSRSEFRFEATDKKNAQTASFSCYLDRVLVHALRPGDILHMARSDCGGLGVSALRQESLIFAAGAISIVPLGPTIQASVPWELVQRAEAVFRQRDPEFEFREYPIEICIGETCSMLFSGSLSRNGYRAWVQHGSYVGMPGTPECAAISLEGACGHTAACATAQLLENE